MNREIKFRFWVEKAQKMGDWETAKKECDRLSLLSFEGFIPMQFTGLKDKNDIEIYEGDICRVLYTDWASHNDPNISLEDYLNSISHLAKVEYYAPEFVFLSPSKHYSGEYTDNSMNVGKHGFIEVVGNIYQNPELL